MKSVICIGDGVLDYLRIGRITRPSPEAPDCPVVVIDEERFELGGAANVARWLAATPDLEVRLYSHQPADDDGVRYWSECKARQIKPGFELQSSVGKMTRKERIVVQDRGLWRHLVRVDRDTETWLSALDLALIKDDLSEKPPSAVVVADYDKGFFRGDAGDELRTWLGQFCCEVGCFLVVNSKVVDRWRAVPATCFVCNDGEFKRARIRAALDEPWGACRYLVITMGASGVQVAPLEVGGAHEYSTLAQQVVDVTGAGDAFLAGLVHKLLQSGVRVRASWDTDLIDDLVRTGQSWAAHCCDQLGCGRPILERRRC